MFSTVSVRRAILALVIIGAVTHFPLLSHPRQVVFDEVHWGKFVSAYCCTGQRVFDVHPPHGKLLLTLGALLGGYDGTQSFETIGLPYEHASAFWMRVVPALAGITIPVLFFLLLRGVGASLAIAWLGGLLLALDNAFILETRTMLFDGILVAASLASIVCLLWMDRATTAVRAWVWAITCGVFAGLAVGTKFTGLAVPALIGLWLARDWWRRREGRGQVVLRGGVIAVAAIAIYLGGWMVHFSLLTQPGPADAFHRATGRFVEDLRVAHRTMIAANAGMTATHPDASHPITWPLMKVQPYFWAEGDAVEYLAGNPVVWWGSTAMLVAILVTRGVRWAMRRPRQAGSWRTWWFLIAYAVSYVPFFGVTRILFLYHYLTPLVFALGFVLVWLDEAGWTRADGDGKQRASYYGVMAAAVVGFALMSPLTYGWSAGAYGQWLVALVRSWR